MMRRSLLACAAMALVSTASSAQHTPRLNVLQLDPDDTFGPPVAADIGLAGLRQRLLALRTNASVMQVTAHPDDEQSGLLTWFSRGTGARTALLTLNRGEAGANAIGSELFDALGLLRAEELALAAQHYGLDDVYFTSAADYGYSKVMAEAARSWDTTAVLRDMVRSIRTNRPVVVIARWSGTERDGHGQHQLAGALAPLAVRAAADPARFPELATEGLAPWRVLRLFRSNLPRDARGDVEIDAGRYDPWIGDTYASLGSDGLSRQRSQTAGKRSAGRGTSLQRLQLVEGAPLTDAADPFAGLPLDVSRLLTLAAIRPTAEGVAAVHAFDVATRDALVSLDGAAPWRIVPDLARAQRALDILDHVANAQRSVVLANLVSVKRTQIARAIASAIGLRVTAIVTELGARRTALVPGERAEVRLTVSHGAPITMHVEHAELVSPSSWGRDTTRGSGADVLASAPWEASLPLAIPADAEPERPAFARAGVAQNLYSWRDAASPGELPRTAWRSPSALRARVALRIGGARLVVERMLRVRRNDEPDGVNFPRAVVVPPVFVRARPAVRVIRDGGEASVRVTVEVSGEGSHATDAEVGVGEATQRVRIAPGERRLFDFDVSLPANADTLTVGAFARVNGREWRDDVTRIEHRELEPAYLYAPAIVRVRRIRVALPAGLEVGYVMGVGDLVPEAIAQLGAHVTLLDAAAVSAGDFTRFDAVVIGTRAYAVRPELPAATAALTAYARAGGRVVVLYQTQEFKPETMAPYAASLPDDAEEVTEEDAPVALLAPDHPLLAAPNRLTSAEFEGWIEQRGSKFLTRLAPEYTALVETHDTGQSPQRGILVTAEVGAGRWSYVALALHRQLPYGVPGAYRILANLLAGPRRR